LKMWVVTLILILPILFKQKFMKVIHFEIMSFIKMVFNGVLSYVLG